MVKKKYTPWEKNLQGYLNIIQQQFIEGRLSEEKMQQMSDTILKWWELGIERGLGSK